MKLINKNRTQMSNSEYNVSFKCDCCGRVGRPNSFRFREHSDECYCAGNSRCMQRLNDPVVKIKHNVKRASRKESFSGYLKDPARCDELLSDMSDDFRQNVKRIIAAVSEGSANDLVKTAWNGIVELLIKREELNDLRRELRTRIEGFECRLGRFKYALNEQQNDEYQQSGLKLPTDVAPSDLVEKKDEGVDSQYVPFVAADQVYDEGFLIIPCPAIKPVAHLQHRVANRLQLDGNMIEQKQSETEKVLTLLQNIFLQEKDESFAVACDPTNNKLMDLDSVHSAFLLTMVTKEVWQRSELEDLASQKKVLLDGVLQTINEEVFEAYGEPLFEDENPIELNADITRQICETYNIQKKSWHSNYLHRR